MKEMQTSRKQSFKLTEDTEEKYEEAEVDYRE
jgi:hypothetical protein